MRIQSRVPHRDVSGSEDGKRDCRRIERPLAELRALEAREAERMRAFVAEQHADLVRNFDPRVVPLRKKLKVMIHPDALRDMGDDGLL